MRPETINPRNLHHICVSEATIRSKLNNIRAPEATIPRKLPRIRTHEATVPYKRRRRARRPPQPRDFAQCSLKQPPVFPRGPPMHSMRGQVQNATPGFLQYHMNPPSHEVPTLLHDVAQASRHSSCIAHSLRGGAGGRGRSPYGLSCRLGAVFVSTGENWNGLAVNAKRLQ